MQRAIRLGVALAAACAALTGVRAEAGPVDVPGVDVNVQQGWGSPEEAPLVPAVPVPVPAWAVDVPPVEASLIDGATGNTSTLPYDYRSRFYDKIRGRDMKTYNNTFCNWYHAYDLENDSADSYTDIQLVLNVDNDFDRYFVKVRYPNDGRWWKYCWSPVHSWETYHFDYIQESYDYALTIEGRVDGK